MKDRSALLSRIYRLKLLLVGALLLILGLLAAALSEWLQGLEVSHLLVAVVNGLSDVLLVTGGIGIAVDFFTNRDRREVEIEQSRDVQKELIPDYVDAVLRGFAAQPQDMKRVATPDFLDQLATNALALRLGDEKFAGAIYAGLMAQAIRSPERWSDVDINVRLSSIEERSTAGAPRSSTSLLLFDVVVIWEYTVVPSARVQRFASTDDQVEFRELLNDLPATSTWYIPDGVADPSDRGSFEVLSYSVDGVDLPIRRTVRKHGQTYSVDLGDAVILEGKPIRVRHVYRTVVPRIGHRFRISLTQPTHGMRLVLDYTESDIASLKVGDMVSSAVPAQVKFLPDAAETDEVPMIYLAAPSSRSGSCGWSILCAMHC
ncbi:MAG: hypothetical protein NTX33_00060 [Propionibacteriales bacterium]|nr:hypothetical protein [Propionibacteriales bacterium]